MRRSLFTCGALGHYAASGLLNNQMLYAIWPNEFSQVVRNFSQVVFRKWLETRLRQMIFGTEEGSVTRIVSFGVKWWNTALLGRRCVHKAHMQLAMLSNLRNAAHLVLPSRASLRQRHWVEAAGLVVLFARVAAWSIVLWQQIVWLRIMPQNPRWWALVNDSAHCHMRIVCQHIGFTILMYDE